MTPSSRFITRVGALTFTALTLAACTEPLAPLDLSQEDIERIAWSIAIEIESGAMQLTPQYLPGTVDLPLMLSIQSRRPGNLGGASFNLQHAGGHPASFQVIDSQCGVPSQSPPTDADADLVPDNLTITFALPACRYVDVNGSTWDLTGVIRVSDPQPSTAAMAFDMALDNLRITTSNPPAPGFHRRDGLASVVASATGLSQTMSWRESAEYGTWDGNFGAAIDLSATYTAAEGASITPGEPLPDGTYVPSGSFVRRLGNRYAQFTITTVEPLQYNAECAARVAAGEGVVPFTSGMVRISVKNKENMGYAQVEFLDCGTGVLYVPEP
jgi:hypothetical protein